MRQATTLKLPPYQCGRGAPCASPVRAEAAQLLAELGRAPEAIATWTGLFGCGYRDPCRALAAEMASRQGPQSIVGEIINGDPQADARREIAELSTAQCFGRLYQSWWERITG